MFFLFYSFNNGRAISYSFSAISLCPSLLGWHWSINILFPGILSGEVSANAFSISQKRAPFFSAISLTASLKDEMERCGNPSRSLARM